MAIILGNDQIRKVTALSEVEKKDIFNFLQGAIYCWCKNSPEEWFSIADLMGGENFQWRGTPLLVLYTKHKSKGKDWDSAAQDAAQDSGWLLKRVIRHDNRKFETKKEELIRKYKWIKD